MNKKNVLWLCALLMLAVGMSSCSSDDEKIVGSGEIIIPDEIPENSLLILSDKGEISWGECYKSGEMYNPPHCYLGGEITFENDTIYHMGFGANIKGSDVFFILTIGFQSNRQMSFNDLKEGDTFDISQFDAAAAYTPTWMEAILIEGNALSGSISVVSKGRVGDKPYITLKLTDLKFNAIDRSCVYTVNGTVVYEVLGNYVEDGEIPDGALGQKTTEFTGGEWIEANAPLWGQGYVQEGNLKVMRNSLGAIEAVDFTGMPAEERPKTVADFYERYYGEGVADYFRCSQHTEWDSGLHFETHDYYQQYYKDVIVKTSSGCISFIDGLMVGGSCDYLPIQDFDVTPSFSEQAAIEIFKSFMNLFFYDENRCELQIVRVPQGDSFGPRLAYEVRRGQEGLVIDAHTGRALYRTTYDWGM